MMFDSRFKAVDLSPTFKINLRVKELRAEGKDLVNFGLGESPFGAPDFLVKALQDNASNTHYLSSRGILPLRKMISKFYREQFEIDASPEQIVVAPGSKELLFLSMLALDGTWVLPTPSWVSYESQAKMVPRKVVRINFDAPYTFQVEKFIKRVSKIDGDFVMLINYPNNPTGFTLRRQDVKRLADFARSNGAMVLSDEIYANLTFESFGETHHSFFKEYPEGTIVTGGVSKDRSLGGWRFGVGIFPGDLAKTIASLASETYSAVASPIQYAMIDAYRSSKVNNFMRNCRKVHELIGEVAYSELKKEFLLAKPQGAFYLMPSLNHKRDALRELGIKTSMDLANMLMNKGVAVLPASAFGLPESELSFRMAYIDYDGKKVLNAFLSNEDAALSNPKRFVEENAPNVAVGLGILRDFATEI